ncbi:helix-turn-helix domain-containing protein [Saprospiraceae bacterium]|jgi:TolB-like protein/AraC-like DNA-binding protein/Tfp pilus assembly protein PilF|nr:helix-turn-helix domain-containing protein [Bacteroidota bacterium]MDB4728308.1 helix-turn-helix domain-containing protein [Saprospiraceae bacterium]MDF1865798.1 adenylate/guanylate cyclase domain-containing protein [Saprospiraceae bacterium]
MKNQKNRRLVAIMFTDIVGYTALMQKDEKAAAAIRLRHREVFQMHHQQYHGDILQYFGDGTLSIFQSGVEAVECAILIQKTLNEKDPLPLRIGIHIGDIVFDGTEIYGDSVNLASRIESMGIAGGILLSGTLNDEVKNQQQISTSSLGQFELKNIAQPVEIFSVTNEGIKVPKQAELKGKQKKQTKTIAVLPFVNMSSSEENEYFSDGMTEEIINALAKIKALKVTSRTSSFFFKDKNISIKKIGKELNVSTILEGSIRLSGNKMRLTAQLIDVTNDFHFWSETFDRSMEDIFAVQDEISLLIADKLREHLGHFEIEEHLVEDPKIPIDIYNKYLKSRYHILKMSRPDIEKGLSILEEIIDNQPNFALAYLGLHLGYTLLGTLGLVPANEAFAKGHPFLNKAIELDANLPESQLHLSYISFLQKWDFKKTYEHLNKSFEMRPSVEYYQSMASTLVAEGKFSAALNYIDTALQLDPFSTINYHLKGFIFYSQERYDQAIEWFEKNAGLKSSFTVSTLYYGQALILAGQAAKSIEYFRNIPTDPAGDLIKLGGITLAYAALGEIDKAEAGIEKLEAALNTELMERAINLLIICQAMLGKKETAFQLIEKGVKNKLPLIIYLYVEPILKFLRPEPRFQELMRQVLGQETTFDISKRKYKKSLLNKDLLSRYKKQLNVLMIEEKPYLDPNLSLRELAKTMKIPPNHLSQLLNEGFDKNFSEYINTYRLETFKSKAADPGHQHLTILALAYDSGFNSKTVFNTFFKKVMGKTPKAYWKEVVKK